MKPTFNRSMNRQAGFSIPEIAVAIFVFAVGMLALGYLQNSLTRSQADSNSRAVATNIAERIIEGAKGFSSTGDGDPSTLTTGALAYDELTEANLVNNTLGLQSPITLSNTVFTVAPNVVDYRWNNATGEFVCYTGEFDNGNDTARCTAGAAPAGSSVNTDFKLLEITVTWDGAGFTSEEGSAEIANLSETITVSSFVSSVTSPTSGKVQNSSNNSVLPAISYTPGQNPDIVGLSLGNNRFKESTTPEPVVNKDLGETTWDVVTYSTVSNNSSFLRREEFRAVACSCEFTNSTADRPEPVYWMGDEYKEGAVVTKVTGTNAATGPTDTSSRLCDRCCENHHDANGASPYQRYRPFDADVTASGNHKHYNIDNSGNLVEVAESNGNEYLEACRMVRVNGFWEVAQDLRNEHRFVVPGDWLDEAGEIEDYSDYLVGSNGDSTTSDGAIEYFFDDVVSLGNSYPGTMPCWAWDGSCADPSPIADPTYSGDYDAALADGEFPKWTEVTASVGQNQLRSRGLYMDFMHPNLVDLIECLEGSDSFETIGSTTDCNVNGIPGVGDAILDLFETDNALEIMPFFEVQLTGLSVWSSLAPVTVTNEPVDDNGYSRGLASSNTTGDGQADIIMRQGNLGLLDVTPNLPITVAPELCASLDVRSVDLAGAGGVPGGGVSAGCGAAGTPIGGNIAAGSNSYKNKFAVGYDSASNAVGCSISSGTWSCTVPDFALAPTVTVTVQTTSGTGTYYICSTSGDLTVTDNTGGSFTIALDDANNAGNAPANLTQNLTVLNAPCP